MILWETMFSNPNSFLKHMKKLPTEILSENCKISRKQGFHDLRRVVTTPKVMFLEIFNFSS